MDANEKHAMSYIVVVVERDKVEIKENFAKREEYKSIINIVE